MIVLRIAPSGAVVPAPCQIQGRKAHLQLVANLAEELLAPLDVGLGFNALGRSAVHDAHDATPLGGFGDQHLGLAAASM